MHSISGAAATPPERRWRSGNDLGGEPAVGELEADQVPGGGTLSEAGDVEQRVVRDAVAEQRARVCPRERGFTY